MRLHALAALLLLASALAGCADGEGTPDPTPSPSPSGSMSASSSTTSTAAGSSSSSSSTSAAPRPAQTIDVDIQGNQFVDGSPTIQRGDTVRWTQRDTNQHTVTADDDSFDSGTMLPVGPSMTFSRTFDAVGEVAYHCDVHPSMTGTITVVQALPP